MIKCKLVCLFLTVATCTFIATAQNSPAGSSPAKATPDPLQSATKPLTPKSAMPAKHKSSAAGPSAVATNKNTTAELTHLEQQNIKAGNSNSGNNRPAKSVTLPKPANTSAASGPGIDFKYQKPVGGMKAAKPNANSPNSTKSRVQEH
jgi:hypothetical protein